VPRQYRQAHWGGGRVFAQVASHAGTARAATTTNSSTPIRYVHSDNLGGSSVVADPSGTVVEAEPNVI